jgi:DNA-binding NtrC family response regulator
MFAVLDVAMPDLNGIEVARYLQDAAPATRIVMLSMHADVEYVHRALLAGAQGYVLKDSAGRVLIEAVRAVHGGRRYICEQIGAQALEQYFRERGHQRSARSPERARARGAAAYGRRKDDRRNRRPAAALAEKRRDLSQPPDVETRNRRYPGAGQIRDPLWDHQRELGTSSARLSLFPDDGRS